MLGPNGPQDIISLLTSRAASDNTQLPQGRTFPCMCKRYETMKTRGPFLRRRRRTIGNWAVFKWQLTIQSYLKFEFSPPLSRLPTYCPQVTCHVFSYDIATGRSLTSLDWGGLGKSDSPFSVGSHRRRANLPITMFRGMYNRSSSLAGKQWGLWVCQTSPYRR